MDSIKLIVKQNILNIKQVILSKMNIIFLFFIIIISLMIPMFFVPVDIAYPLIFLLSLIPVNGAVFSVVNFNLKKSTLNKNYNITKSNRWVFNLSTITTMLIFTFIIFNFLYFSIAISNDLGFLLIGWRHYPSASDEFWFNFWDISTYILTLYSTLIISLIVFSISFFMSHFITSQKNYFIFILTFLILAIVFGGAFNKHFLLDNDKGAVLHNGASLFPKSLYWITFIFPFGPSGQLLSQISVLSKWIISGIDHNVAMKSYWGYLNALQEFRIISFQNTLLWNLTLIMPYVQIILFGVLGIIVSKRK